MKLTKKLVGSYAYVFSSPEGKEVLQDLLELTGAEDVTDPTDSEREILYNAGKRDTYLYINAMVEEGQK